MNIKSQKPDWLLKIKDVIIENIAFDQNINIPKPKSNFKNPIIVIDEKIPQNIINEINNLIKHNHDTQ
jgi:hypothetical protein